MSHLSPEIVCSTCGRSNARGARFCFACGSDLVQETLAELDRDELSTALDALLETSLELRRSAGGSPPAPVDAELLRSYLNAFWLRPETALTQAVEARRLGPLLGAQPGPLLDLGCGDGIHISLALGWRFADSFDAFEDLDFARADVFDAAPRGRRRPELRRRGRTIDCGVDIKPSSAARTARLGAFSGVLVADASALPLPSESFRCIHSNAVPNLDDRVLPAILGECARLLERGGALILVTAAENYRDSLYFSQRARAAEAAGRLDEARRLTRLDRGRSGDLIRGRTCDRWGELLGASGLEIEQELRFLPPALLRFWDTGLRPFTPILGSWRTRSRRDPWLAEVKRCAVSIMESLLGPAMAEPTEHPEGTFRMLVARR